MLNRIRLLFIHFLIFQFFATSVFPMHVLLDEEAPPPSISVIMDNAESGDENFPNTPNTTSVPIDDTVHEADDTKLIDRLNSAGEVKSVHSRKGHVLNTLIERRVMPANCSMPLLGLKKTEMQSSICIIDETVPIPDSLHTNTPLFCNDFDEIHYNRTVSLETRALQSFFALIGLMVPWGWVPLGMSMAGPALGYLPTGSVAANVFVFSLIGFVTFAFANQMANLGKSVGNAVLDGHGFDTTKEDMRPHIKPLSYRAQFKFPHSQTIRFITIPVRPAIMILSAVYAGFKMAPRTLLFWIAEKYFPIYRGIFIGPLALSMFEESYKVAYKSWLGNFSQRNPAIALRERILQERLNDMRKLVNAPRSNSLVNELFALFQTAKADNFQKTSPGILAFLLRNSKLIKFIYTCFRGPIENEEIPKSRERIFIASLFFLQKTLNPGIEMQRGDIIEARRSLATTNADIPEPLRIILDAGINSAADSGLTGWSRFFEDIETTKTRTQARRFIEGNSNYISGVAAIGAFLLILWVADQVFPHYGNRVLFTYQEFDLNLRTTIAGTVALAQAALDPFSEWYTRDKAFLSFRNVFSTHEDFWGLRKCAIALSSFLAGFGTLAYLAILITLPEAPLYIKVLPALGLMANQFLIFYWFFHTQYNDVLTKFVTTGSKKVPTPNSYYWERKLKRPLNSLASLQTSRKRAEINVEIDRLMALLPYLDDVTIEQLYHLTQGGL